MTTKKLTRGQKKLAARRLHIASLQSEPQLTINRMTNRQRSAWGRAGYPMDVEKIKEFMT